MLLRAVKAVFLSLGITTTLSPEAMFKTGIKTECKTFKFVPHAILQDCCIQHKAFKFPNAATIADELPTEYTKSKSVTQLSVTQNREDQI